MGSSNNFVHLRTHSEYSLKRGFGSATQYAQQAVTNQQPALAITDYHTLSGALKHVETATKFGVKPVVGMLVNFHQNRVDPEPALIPTPGTTTTTKYVHSHLTVLATNSTGWGNLLALHNKTMLDADNQTPIVDHQLLKEHSAGLIVLSGGWDGPVGQRLLANDLSGALDQLRWLIDSTQPGSLFLETWVTPGLPQFAVDGLLQLSQQVGIPIVAAAPVHYPTAELAKPWSYRATNHNSVTPPQPLLSETQVRALEPAQWWQQACDQTTKIAEMVNPNVINMNGHTTPTVRDDGAATLRQLVSAGARQKYGVNPTDPTKLLPHINDRVAYEFRTITNRGLVDYFLLVKDLVDWCQSTRDVTGQPGSKKPIRVGGRGSVASSIIAYALGIVDVDPIEHGLLFERFLDPGRPDLPDIDIDVEESRRSEVHQYLQHRWGARNVVHAGATKMCRAKAAVNEAGRALKQVGVATKLRNRIIDDTKLHENLESVKDLLSTEQGQQVWELATLLEDSVEYSTIHACAMIISARPIDELVPLRLSDSATNGVWVAGWDGDELLRQGFLKLDILALRHLSIIQTCLDLVEQSSGPTMPLGHQQIGADPKVWQTLASGHTATLFQIGSDQFTNLVVAAKPNNLDELAALNALHRPAVLATGLHLRWLNPTPTNSPGLTVPEQELLDSVLNPTRGVLVYQEQVMQLAYLIAGFTPAQVSTLRAALKSVDQETLAQLREQWLVGTHNGVTFAGNPKPSYSTQFGQTSWALVVNNSRYGFNKAHAVSYALLTLQGAWLKTVYPQQWVTAVLRHTKTDRRQQQLGRLAREGHHVLGPDLNVSDTEATTVGGVVRLGLGEVKGVGAQAQTIVEQRNSGGPFGDFQDTVERLHKVEKLPLTTIGALIEAGAFDQFGTRLGMLTMLRANKPPLSIEFAPERKWWLERDRLGVASSMVHPLVRVREQLSRIVLPGGQQLVGLHAAVKQRVGEVVGTVGVVTNVVSRSYPSGRLTKLTVEGSATQTVLNVWNIEKFELPQLPKAGEIWLFTGRVTARLVERENPDGSTRRTERTELSVTGLWQFQEQLPPPPPPPDPQWGLAVAANMPVTIVIVNSPGEATQKGELFDGWRAQALSVFPESGVETTGVWVQDGHVLVVGVGGVWVHATTGFLGWCNTLVHREWVVVPKSVGAAHINSGSAPVSGAS